MMRIQKRCAPALLAAGALALAACSLDVRNPNAPETARVLATPPDLESFLGSTYNRWHDGVYRTTGNTWGMAAVQSFEDYSSLSNNCMGQRVGIPRAANDNSVGNGCSGEQIRVYQVEAEVDRTASNVLRTMAANGFTLGSPAQDNRAKAFAEFLRGLSLGYLSLVHDSAAVITPETSPEDPGELKAYPEVNQAALDAFQKAIDYTNASVSGGGGNGFPLPSTWISSTTSFTAPEFIKLIRSYRARIRANVARSTQERAAVNWDAVIADAQNGITADHDNITNTTSGPFNSWVAQWYSYGTWHQMAPFVIGMADNSGSYAAWIATPLDNRGAGNTGFFMTTPDLRFPQGATRAAQNADFALTQCSAAATPCKRYFVNRPQGQDQFAGFGWGWSNYDHARFYSWRTAGDAGTGQNGKFPFFTLAELNLLEAEGHIRKGEFSAAAALINKTRTKNGLPAIAVFDATTAVPGGADCVPKVPVGPNYNTVACGNLLEAMKYEKRIETAYTHFMGWFFDMRGWGDLPQGTGLDWPVPYQDLQARSRAIYSTGGGANPHSAPKGTYGW